MIYALFSYAGTVGDLRRLLEREQTECIECNGIGTRHYSHCEAVN